MPFVRFVDGWEPDRSPPAFRGLYVASLKSDPVSAAAAAIPVERIQGEVLVVGGDDDQVWPSAEFARMVVARRHDHGLATTLITHSGAGHRATFPGESPVVAGQQMARGGTPGADAELGARAWPLVAKALRLNGVAEPARTVDVR